MVIRFGKHKGDRGARDRAERDRESRHVDPALAGEIVRTGYRSLASRSHPDVGGSTETMTRLNIARDWLLRRVRGALGP